jgi:hypothetical protein
MKPARGDGRARGSIMRFPSFDEAEQLKAQWSDKFVRVKSAFEEYKRFEGKIGRVVTVNFGGKAIVDFADGAWYDVPATADHLEVVPDAEAQGKYDSTMNSAQKIPSRQS